MQYREQMATLTDLTVEDSPERYDLCGAHADRTRPPRGWTLDDDRSDDGADIAISQGPRSVDDTVAILAAALRDDLTVAPAAPETSPETSEPEPALDDLLEHEVDDRLEDVVDTPPSAPAPAVTPTPAATEAPPATTVASWPAPAAQRDTRA